MQGIRALETLLIIISIIQIERYNMPLVPARYYIDSSEALKQISKHPKYSHEPLMMSPTCIHW